MSTLVDLATAKQYLMIGHTQQDAVVQILADGVESFLGTHLGATFTSAAFQEDLDGGMGVLLPTNRPVTALTVQSGQTYPTVLDRVGDILGITPEETSTEALYRVKASTRVLDTTSKEVSLERMDRPVSP